MRITNKNETLSVRRLTLSTKFFLFTSLVLISAFALAASPTLDPIGNRSVNELQELTFTATASDPDLPGDTLTFSLDPGRPGRSKY